MFEGGIEIYLYFFVILSTTNLHKTIDLILKLIYNMSNYCKRYYRR